MNIFISKETKNSLEKISKDIELRGYTGFDGLYNQIIYYEADFNKEIKSGGEWSETYSLNGDIYELKCLVEINGQQLEIIEKVPQ